MAPETIPSIVSLKLVPQAKWSLQECCVYLIELHGTINCSPSVTLKDDQLFSYEYAIIVQQCFARIARKASLVLMIAKRMHRLHLHMYTCGLLTTTTQRSFICTLWKRAVHCSETVWKASMEMFKLCNARSNSSTLKSMVKWAPGQVWRKAARKCVLYQLCVMVLEGLQHWIFKDSQIVSQREMDLEHLDW